MYYVARGEIQISA